MAPCLTWIFKGKIHTFLNKKRHSELKPKCEDALRVNRPANVVTSAVIVWKSNKIIKIWSWVMNKHKAHMSPLPSSLFSSWIADELRHYDNILNILPPTEVLKRKTALYLCNYCQVCVFVCYRQEIWACKELRKLLMVTVSTWEELVISVEPRLLLSQPSASPSTSTVTFTGMMTVGVAGWALHTLLLWLLQHL